MQLSVKDAARLLKVSEKTLYRWIKQSSVPHYKINEEYRFNRVELLEWATAKRLSISAEIFVESEGRKDSLPTLYDALVAGGIIYDVRGRDQASVLRSIVSRLKLPAEVDRDFLYEVLLAREMLGSTGIGDGIAIPHVRNPVVLHIEKPTITLCFLEESIDFKAIDGKPVNILFTIISPTVSTHLHLLSRLGYIFSNSDFKALLRKKAPREELMEFIAAVESQIPAPSGSNDSNE